MMCEMEIRACAQGAHGMSCKPVKRKVASASALASSKGIRPCAESAQGIFNLSRTIKNSRSLSMAGTFQKDAEYWLQTRKPFIAPKTFHEYELNIKTLTKFFGDHPLAEITPQMVRDYQLKRMAECGAPAINHETNCLQQILKRHRLWAPFEGDYQKLPRSRELCGRILTDEEYERLATLDLRDTGLEQTFLLVIISINTSAGPKELVTLRLKDIFLENSLFRIQPEGAKNGYRIRTIPLNKSALGAVRRALDLARERGAHLPEHYLFPLQTKRNHFDPSRHAHPQQKYAWNTIKKLADIKTFRFYDLRHHAITSLLADPLVSDETVEAIAGHISKEMKKRYSHIQIETKRQALDRLDRETALNIEEWTEAVIGDALTNGRVIEMLKQLSPEVVKAKIAFSMNNCIFDTSVEALMELKKASVPDEIITTMLLVPVQNTAAVPVEAMSWARSRPSIKVRMPKPTANPEVVAMPGLKLRDEAYDREQLEREVWERPLREVAPKYNLSDVGLAKLCRRLNIQLPGRGHWLRKNM